jgi:hypothetical protein
VARSAGIASERTDPHQPVAPPAQRRAAMPSACGAPRSRPSEQTTTTAPRSTPEAPGPHQRIEARSDPGPTVPVDDPRSRLRERRVRIPPVERARQTGQSRPEREHLDAPAVRTVTAPSCCDRESQHGACDRRHGPRHVEHEHQRTCASASLPQRRIDQLAAPPQRSLETPSEIELSASARTGTASGPARGRDPERADGAVDRGALFVGRARSKRR